MTEAINFVKEKDDNSLEIWDEIAIYDNERDIHVNDYNSNIIIWIDGCSFNKNADECSEYPYKENFNDIIDEINEYFGKEDSLDKNDLEKLENKIDVWLNDKSCFDGEI